MIVEKIQNILKQQKRNIIFYFDEDGSFKEELKAIEDDGIKVVEVSNNYFELKYKKNEGIKLMADYNKEKCLF